MCWYVLDCWYVLTCVHYTYLRACVCLSVCVICMCVSVCVINTQQMVQSGHSSSSGAKRAGDAPTGIPGIKNGPRKGWKICPHSWPIHRVTNLRWEMQHITLILFFHPPTSPGNLWPLHISCICVVRDIFKQLSVKFFSFHMH